MSTFSSLGVRTRSARAESTDQVSPIKDEEEELVAAAATRVAGATAVGGGGDRNIRRYYRKLPRAARDWSSLPEPAIQLILMGMRPSLGDVFSFAGVCKAWRSVFTDWKLELFSSLPPLLVDCGSSPEGLGWSYGLVKQHSFRRKQPIPLPLVRPGVSPDLSDWCVIGVSHGYWIVTSVKKNSQRRSVFLLDPLLPEQSRIELPPSPFFFSRFGIGILAGELLWAMMTAPPTSPDCVVVVADRCCIWYCRLGDAEWVRHDFSDVLEAAPWCFNEDRVAVLSHRLYALLSLKKLVVVELLLPRPKVAVVDVEGLTFHHGELGHLVLSDGEILFIADKGCFRYWEWEPFDGCFGPGRPRCECPHRFVVQRLDLPARRWVALDTLGKRSIFLPRHLRMTRSHGGTPLTCVGAAEWGCREDCIYSNCGTSGTLAVWNMKDGSVEHHPLPEERRYSEWLVPSFCYRASTV